MLRTLGTKVIACHAHTLATQRTHQHHYTILTTNASPPLQLSFTPQSQLHSNDNYNPIMHPCYLLSKFSVCNCISWLIAGAKCFAPSAPRSLSDTRTHTHISHTTHTHQHHYTILSQHQRITTIKAVIYTTITTTTTTTTIPSCILATYSPNLASATALAGLSLEPSASQLRHQA